MLIVYSLRKDSSETVALLLSRHETILETPPYQEMVLISVTPGHNVSERRQLQSPETRISPIP
ncbi:hypothetical protein DPMN_147566 [Dreissena polymorpha]|uniref:Uncharacterized protein n=1 Tax=Dreissena polymorpha TaxID=45954 RepID=A0A9D4F988_DREPO|nr:hypothetical protein DPMN_147566 [Dreissena polymorpha]